MRPCYSLLQLAKKKHKGAVHACCHHEINADSLVLMEYIGAVVVFCAMACRICIKALKVLSTWRESLTALLQLVFCRPSFKNATDSPKDQQVWHETVGLHNSER